MFENQTPYIPMSAAQYKELRESGTPHLLLDVREPFEFRQAHIQGAVLMPMNEVPTQLDDLRDHDTIVVACRTGNRSAMVATFLRDSGLTSQIYNLEGGIVAWAQQGNPYVTGDT